MYKHNEIKKMKAIFWAIFFELKLSDEKYKYSVYATESLSLDVSLGPKKALFPAKCPF